LLFCFVCAHALCCQRRGNNNANNNGRQYLSFSPKNKTTKRKKKVYGGMIGVHLRGGLPASRAFLERLRLFALAESLGGVESLAEHPAIM
jgi:cystathionine beta-lyase/cystathionine gamma-synthase